MRDVTSRLTSGTSSLVLYLAFDLSQADWHLEFTIGAAQSPRERQIKAADLPALQQESQLAKQRFALPSSTAIRSCYEAGRDGFWLHRYLVSQGIENLVVASASLEVNRRAKRAKTDRLDVGKLLAMLMRYHQGEKKVWSVVPIPSVEPEDERHLHRTWMTLNADRTRHLNRLKGLLSAQGVHLAVGTDFEEELQGLRLWDGSPLRVGWLARVKREWVLLQAVEAQIREVEAERREALRSSAGASVAQVRQLLRLRGIREHSAWLYVMELFGWRQFHNRREMGGLRV